MMDGPASWYWALVIHMSLKVESELKIYPPIHVKNLRYGCATTLTFMVEGARAVISLVIR